MQTELSFRLVVECRYPRWGFVWQHSQMMQADSAGGFFLYRQERARFAIRGVTRVHFFPWMRKEGPLVTQGGILLCMGCIMHLALMSGVLVNL